MDAPQGKPGLLEVQGPPTPVPSGSESMAAVRKLTAGLAFESILAHANKLTASDKSVRLETDPTLQRVREIGRDSYLDAVSAHVRRIVAAQQKPPHLPRTISAPAPESRDSTTPPTMSSEVIGVSVESCGLTLCAGERMDFGAACGVWSV